MFISNYTRSGSHENAVAISNSADVPFGFGGHRDEKLSPTTDLLTRYHAREITTDQYGEEYIALLVSRGVTPEGVLAKHTADAVFVCYDYEDGEADGGDADGASPFTCHRYILAKWLNENGVPVTEI